MNLRATIAMGVFWTSLLVGSAGAIAQESARSNELGIRAFERGEYEQAARHFGDAASKSPDPLLRKNEAVAWFKAKKCEEALEAANAFLLRWEARDANRTEAASVIANCKTDLARDAIDAENFDLAQKLLFEAEEYATDSYTKDRISAVRVRLTEARNTRREPEVKPPTQADERPLTSSAGFWLTSAGGAIIAAGVIYHLYVLASVVPALEDESQGGDADEYDSLAGQVDTARWLVPVLYGVGATTTGIGVWLLLDPQDDTESAHSWNFGISYSTSF